MDEQRLFATGTTAPIRRVSADEMECEVASGERKFGEPRPKAAPAGWREALQPFREVLDWPLASALDDDVIHCEWVRPNPDGGAKLGNFGLYVRDFRALASPPPEDKGRADIATGGKVHYCYKCDHRSTEGAFGCSGGPPLASDASGRRTPPVGSPALEPPMTSPSTPAPVVSAEDMPMREKIALTVYLGNYHNSDHASVTKGWNEGQYDYCQAKYYRIADAVISGPIAAMQAEHQRTVEDYEEVLADARRLTREIDVALHGEEGAAKQASLCDLVEPARQARERIASLEAQLSAKETNDVG